VNTYYRLRYGMGKIKKAASEVVGLSAYKLGLTRPPNNSSERLLRCKNKYEGLRCFIVGNAPSLNQMDLSKLKNEYCFVFNGAFDIANGIALDKCFHVVEDRLVFEDHQTQLNDLQHQAFYPSDLSRLVTSSRPIICPFSRAWPEWAPSWPPIVTTSTLRPVFYWGGTVAIFGLQLAIWMGFSEIYIIGVDLDYKIPASVTRNGTILTSTTDDPNHYKPTYFGAGLRWHVPLPERMQRAFKRYRNMLTKPYIYNAGYGGKLEAFPRCPFNSLFD